MDYTVVVIIKLETVDSGGVRSPWLGELSIQDEAMDVARSVLSCLRSAPAYFS